MRGSPAALRRAVLLASFGLAALLVLGGAMAARQALHLGLSGARDQVVRAVRVAEGVVNRHLLQVDGALATLDGLLAGPAGRGGGGGAEADRLLRDLAAQSFVLRNLWLLRPDGTVWASGEAARGAAGSPPVPPEALRPTAPGGAGFAGPVASPTTGEEALFVSRVADIPGEPGLIAVAEVPLSLVEAVLAPAEFRAGLRLRLETSDGRVVAAGPGQRALVGRSLPPVTAGEPRRGTDARREPDRLGGAGGVLAAASRIHYGGLVAVAELPEALALAEARRDAALSLGGAGALAALAAGLGLALAAALRAREAAERERAASRATLEAAIDALPDGFVMWDARDRLVVCNSAYRELYAASAPAIRPGATAEDIVRYGIAAGQYPEAGADPEGFLRRLLGSRRAGAAPYERLLPDGRWILVSEKAMPGGGGAVGLRTDITALKRAAEEQARLRAEADGARAAKSRMVAHVSHEMRAPLGGLLRLADSLCASAALPEEERARAGRVAAAARHLLAIANEVLDLAAMEAGRLELAAEATDPRAVAREVVDLALPLAEEARVALALEAAPGLPARVRADPVRLRQVLLNLVGNAVRHSPAGGTVRLALGAEGGVLRAEVTDEGAGVPEADRARLFADFVRLAPSDGQGAGLGLAISARLVSLMGGRIGCADNPAGAGALFWAELPLRPVEEAGRAASAEADADPAPPTRPLRLLAVDDVPANLSVLRALLGGTGCRLEMATTGPMALDLLAEAAAEGDPFDVVLMDVMMPGMDGLETTRRLRAAPGALGRTPVVAVTASAFPEDVAACLAAGMNAHLAKPVSRKALLAALGEAAPAPRRRGAGAAPPAGDALAALRPAFLAEVLARLPGLENAEGPPEARAVAAHALVAAAGGLGLPDVAEEARAAMRALRDGGEDGPARAAALARRLRGALPELSGVG